MKDVTFHVHCTEYRTKYCITPEQFTDHIYSFNLFKRFCLRSVCRYCSTLYIFFPRDIFLGTFLSNFYQCRPFSILFEMFNVKKVTVGQICVMFRLGQIQGCLPVYIYIHVVCIGWARYSYSLLYTLCDAYCSVSVFT